MIDADALDMLRWRLVPAGTPMKDVPADRRGLSWSEYMEVHHADMRTEAYRANAGAAQCAVAPVIDDIADNGAMLFGFADV